MSFEIDPRERRSIRSDLSSPDDEIRRLAVERLVALPTAEALELLVTGLGDPSWRVRKAAVERLAAAPPEWPLAATLLAALADGDNPGRRNAAVEALVRCGERMVPELLGATSNADVDVRKLVIDALAGIGSETAIPRLVTLLGDEDPNVRAAAADAIGAIGGSEAVPALLRAATLENDDPLVRFSALRGLARLEAPVPAHELGAALDDPVLRAAAFSVLGRADDPEAEERLLKGLESNSRSTREAAMEALLRIVGHLDEPSVANRMVARVRAAASQSSLLIDDAVGRLSGADLGTKLVLVQFLGLLGREEAVLPLLAAAKDEALAEVALSTLAGLEEMAESAIARAWPGLDAESRRLACELLSRTRGDQGTELLLGALEEPASDLRAIAARALGARRAASAVPALVRRLEFVAADADPDTEEERTALPDALIAIARPSSEVPASVTEEAVTLLAARLEGATESVRLAIARVLGEIGGNRHAPVVSFLLQDPSASVRRAAVAALARLERGVVSEPLRLALADESPGVRIAAAQALSAATAPEALVDLGRLVEDEDAHVRAAAVRAIGQTLRRERSGRAGPPSGAQVQREARAFELLRAALDDDGSVAIAAVEAFEAAGGSECVEAMQQLLVRAEPELLLAVLRCLAAHASRSQLLSVIALVSHPVWMVRAETVRALAERGVKEAVPTILRRLETEQDDFVRDAILRALARLED